MCTVFAKAQIKVWTTETINSSGSGVTVRVLIWLVRVPTACVSSRLWYTVIPLFTTTTEPANTLTRRGSACASPWGAFILSRLINHPHSSDRVHCPQESVRHSPGTCPPYTSVLSVKPGSRPPPVDYRRITLPVYYCTFKMSSFFSFSHLMFFSPTLLRPCQTSVFLQHFLINLHLRHIHLVSRFGTSFPRRKCWQQT